MSVAGTTPLLMTARKFGMRPLRVWLVRKCVHNQLWLGVASIRVGRSLSVLSGSIAGESGSRLALPCGRNSTEEA